MVTKAAFGSDAASTVFEGTDVTYQEVIKRREFLQFGDEDVQNLSTIRERRAKVVVVDITGVPLVDSKVANHLVQTVEAARLMGATAILTGMFKLGRNRQCRMTGVPLAWNA